MALKWNVTAVGDTTVRALQLQISPPVYVTVISRWVAAAAHDSPNWRVKDPQKGFQRIVNQARAKQIARTVLDEGRAIS